MELAVNMPEHEPQVGQAPHSMALSPSSSSVPAWCRPTASNTLFRSMVRPVQPPGEHRPAADHDGGHVEAHGGHQHAGHDLVARRHQHQGVEGVGDGHRLDGVGDQLAAGQRVVHARVVHGDAVADAHHAELERHAAGAAHAGLDGVDDAAQMHVPGHHFAERVGDADERPLHLGVADAQGAQQRAVRGTRDSVLDLVASHAHHALSESDSAAARAATATAAVNLESYRMRAVRCEGRRAPGLASPPGGESRFGATRRAGV